MERSHERFISPNVQIRPKTFKNVYERSKKEDVRERYRIFKFIMLMEFNYTNFARFKRII